MKVAVNRCFGGFGLSTEAVIRLVERGSAFLDVHEESAYYGSDVGSDFYNKYSAPSVRTAHRDGYATTPMLHDILHKDGKVYSFMDSNPKARACPVLISVIEEMGEAANGRHAKIEIVEIPDGIEWEIDEYDGSETIDEAHRSW